MGAAEAEAFLSDPAVRGNVSASTQNQALSALLFLYKQVLKLELPWLGEVVRAKKPSRLPVVLSTQEVQQILAQLQDEIWLMEVVRLRVKDVDFGRKEILICDGKGMKDRVTVLPLRLVAPSTRHLQLVRATHNAEVSAGRGDVYLPDALARKYPKAPWEWAWQYVFPAGSLSVDPRSGKARRHHSDEKRIQRHFKQAVRAAGIEKLATLHTLRHSLPHTYWRAVRIFALFRSCSAMRT